jgi:hypothetical protein
MLVVGRQRAEPRIQFFPHFNGEQAELRSSQETPSLKRRFQPAPK